MIYRGQQAMGNPLWGFPMACLITSSTGNTHSSIQALPNKLQKIEA